MLLELSQYITYGKNVPNRVKSFFTKSEGEPISRGPMRFHVFHAACAAALATDLIVDLSTFFHPPAPYHQFFVLTTQAGECNNEQGGTDGINGS